MLLLCGEIHVSGHDRGRISADPRAMSADWMGHASERESSKSSERVFELLWVISGSIPKLGRVF